MNPLSFGASAHVGRRTALQGVLGLLVLGPQGALAQDDQEIEQRSRFTAARDQTFSRYIAGRLPQTAYSFGSLAQVPWAEHGVAIRSLADLGQHFNALEDFTGATTINGELQVYASAFNATDHRLGEARLDLWANLPGGQWTVRFGSQPDGRLGWALDGSPIGWDRIPAALLPHANEWRVGQLVALQNHGLYRVSAIEPGVSLQLAALVGSPATGEFLYNILAFLPIDSAQATTPIARDATSLRFAPGALSRTIEVGHRIAALGADTPVRNAGDVFVTEIDHEAGLVQLNQGMPLADLPSGKRMLFYPRITAGQVWTQRHWDLSHPQAYLAVEFDITLFEGLSAAFEPAGIGGGAALQRVVAEHPDAPFGAWPALWAYIADEANIGNGGGASEMDFMEMWVNPNSGMRLLASGNVGGTAIWTREGEGYSVTGNGRNRLPYSLAGRHKIAVVYTGQLTYHYLDDVLVRIEQYRWTSRAPLQIGMNLAMGSIDRNFAANLHVPLRPESFERAHMGIQEVRIWHRSQ